MPPGVRLHFHCSIGQPPVLPPRTHPVEIIIIRRRKIDPLPALQTLLHLQRCDTVTNELHRPFVQIRRARLLFVDSERIRHVSAVATEFCVGDLAPEAARSRAHLERHERQIRPPPRETLWLPVERLQLRASHIILSAEKRHHRITRAPPGLIIRLGRLGNISLVHPLELRPYVAPAV